MQIIQKFIITLVLCFFFTLANAETETLGLAITPATENAGALLETKNVLESEHNDFILTVPADDAEAIKKTADSSSSFFLDATISSFNLIIDFDRPLFFVVWTSLMISLVAVLIATLIGLPLGVVVALNTFKGKRLLMTCLNTLMALPTVVVGLLLYGILNRQGVLGSMGLLYTRLPLLLVNVS